MDSRSSREDGRGSRVDGRDSHEDEQGSRKERSRTRGEVEEQGEVVSIEHAQGRIRHSPTWSMLALAPHPNP